MQSNSVQSYSKGYIWCSGIAVIGLEAAVKYFFLEKG